MLYIIIILIMMTIITSLNIIFNPIYPFYVYIIACILFTVLVIIVDGIVAFIIRRMPEKYFDYHKKIFNASSKKLKLYKALGVKKWKDKVPELGMFTNFRKNKIDDPKNSEYLKRYILEACYGVIIHYVSVPFSFIIMLLDINMYANGSNLYLTIALPVAIVNAVLIVLPAFILRFNLPKLIRLYEYSLKTNTSK